MLCFCLALTFNSLPSSTKTKRAPHGTLFAFGGGEGKNPLRVLVAQPKGFAQFPKKSPQDSFTNGNYPLGVRIPFEHLQKAKKPY